MPDPEVHAQDEICALRLNARSGVPLVGGMVEQAGELLGLAAAERRRLGAMVQVVMEVIVADSFPGAEVLDLDVSVGRRPGVMSVVVSDRGAPSKLVQGNLPPQVADLIRLGFADQVEVHGEGLAGNRTQITKSLPYRSVAGDEAFPANTDEPVVLDDAGIPVLDIRPMVAADVLEVARLFHRVYGYSLVQSASVYEPERLAELVTAGEHLATVAVTPTGRIVGHIASEITDPRLRTGRIGLLAVDPAYRAHNVAAMVSYAQYERLLELGMLGQYSEAVTVHARSQKVALRSGAHEVGMMLAGQHSGMAFEGFQTAQQRHAAMMFYGFVGDPGHRIVHVPASHVEAVTRIYAAAGLPRTIAPRDPRPRQDLPGDSRFKVVLSHRSGVARLTVEQYGADFDTALLSQLTELRLNRYDLIMVHLPMADPGTGFFGNGLAEMGLSFCGVFPELALDGDVLLVQSLNNVDFDREAIMVASPHGQFVRDYVLADLDRAQDRSARLVRSRAQMARFYEALE